MKYIQVFLLIAFSMSGFSQTTSEWRGPGRTGEYFETGLLKQWPAEGPEKIWSYSDLPGGYASPAMGEEFIYVTGRQDSIETLTALTYEGKKVWEVPFGQAWDESYPETRTTPTIYNGNVYLISGRGEIACHNGQSGDQIWYVNGLKEFSGVYNLYGPSESPLVFDNKVIYTSGGAKTSVVALDADSGDLIWKTKSIGDSSAYVSPILINHKGQEMVVTVMTNHALGIDPSNGNIRWTFDYIGLPSRQNNRYMKITNCNSPLYYNGNLFINKGYDHPSAMLTLNETGTRADLKWTSFDFDTHMGGYVLVDGFLYGSNWLNNGAGNWVCADWETGQTQWEEKWNSKGSIILADGMLYFYDDKRGNVALVQPNPEKLEIISSFKIDEGSGPHWAHPVIHEGVLYIRHGSSLMAFRIK